MSLKLGNTSIGSLYLGSTKISEAYLGNVKVLSSGPVDPFNEVDSSLFNANYGITWGNTPGINSNYYPSGQAYSQPNNPQLYRKVIVNAPITITSFDTNCNQGVQSQGTEMQYYPQQLNTQMGLWPSYVTIYDSNLNLITINSESVSSYTIVGTTTSYIESGDGKNYTWYFIHTYCNVTLQPGYYWWPLFQRKHANISRTHYGYYAGISGDMMALRQWNVTNDTTYPPLYLQTTNRPYLKLTDSNNRDWYV